MKTEQDVLEKLGITRGSYITYWINTSGKEMKTSGLANNEEEASWHTQYVHMDCKTVIRSEKGTIPFNFE